MKSMLKSFFCLVLLASGTAFGAKLSSGCCDVICPQECADNKSGCNVFGKTYYAYRPQDSNTARKMMGVEDKIHLFGKEEFYGVASVALEYQQTFNANDLAKWFSFTGNPTMSYGNECDGSFDIYGLNFGTTGSGVICFDPRIKNLIADFDFFIGLDSLFCGLWARVGLPVVYTNWNLKLQDNNKGVGGETATLIANEDDSLAIYNLYPDLRSSFAGNKTTGNTANEAFPVLTCGKICGKRSTTQLANVKLDLGYDFIRRECGHLALSLHADIATTSRPCANYLFNAVVGTPNNRLGATLNAGYELWRGCEGDRSLAVYLDATLVHLFKARQGRLLGLVKNGAGSSYLLLKKFDTAGSFVDFERAANVLCCDVKVGVDAMFDGALMFQYDWCDYSFGLGYNLWLRSREKARSICCDLAENTYGVAGNRLFTAAQINQTQSQATIGDCGTDVDATTVFIKPTDINVCPALHPRAFSNKVFSFLGYNWRDCEWQPYALIGAEVEFGNNNKAVDQWGVILKGGISF